MKFRLAALPLVLTFMAVSATAASNDANVFNLVNTSGKSIGNASYKLTHNKDGYHLVGKFQYHFAAGGPATEDIGTKTVSGLLNEAQITEDLKFNDNGDFLSGYTQNSTNQMMTSFQPDKARKQVTVNQIQGGVSLGSSDIPMPRPDFLVEPDYDPGTLQVLLAAAIAHPHADKLYLMIVPAGSNPRAGSSTVYVTIQEGPDAPAGTLDGKPITLKHFLLGFHASKADAYTDGDGNLMQADMAALHASYIRAKFVMTTPK
jgi:hypothetical protein